jgi:hypothetical protein
MITFIDLFARPTWSSVRVQLVGASIASEALFRFLASDACNFVRKGSVDE